MRCLVTGHPIVGLYHYYHCPGPDFLGEGRSLQSDRSISLCGNRTGFESLRRHLPVIWGGFDFSPILIILVIGISPKISGRYLKASGLSNVSQKNLQNPAAGFPQSSYTGLPSGSPEGLDVNDSCSAKDKKPAGRNRVTIACA